MSRFESRIFESLRRITRALDLSSRHLAQVHQLTAPQFVCLRQLHAAGGHLTPGRLARAASLSQATITGILKRLETRGVIERTRDPADRRRIVVRLTDDGLRLLTDAPDSPHERFSQRLARLDEGEQAILDWTLRRVADMMALTDDDEVDPARQDD